NGLLDGVPRRERTDLRPDSRRDLSVAFRRPRGVCVEPADELLVHDALNILGATTGLQTRQDASDFRFVLIRVVFEVDSRRIFFEEDLGEPVVEALVLLPQSLSAGPNVIPGRHANPSNSY